MKHLTKTISVVALCAATTTAYANSTTFEMGGTLTGLQDGCEFVEVNDGDITYNDSTFVWSTTNPATIKTRSRNINNIVVAAEFDIRDVGGTIVDQSISLDMVGSSVVTNNTNEADNITGTVGIGTFTVNGSGLQAGNVLDIDIHNTIQGSTGFIPVNNVRYYVDHIITCTQ